MCCTKMLSLKRVYIVEIFSFAVLFSQYIGRHTIEAFALIAKCPNLNLF